jgi:hypothetical protein
VRFFVYISDVKVDALLADLSAAERGELASPLTIDSAWLDLAHAPPDAPDELRFARAEVAARRLEQRGEVASLGHARPYVGDTRSLHWGRLRHMRGAELLRHETESPVWFADLAAGLVMVGSASRLLAQPPAARTDHARSTPAPESAWFTPALIATELDAIDRRCLEQAFEPTPMPDEGAPFELPDFSGAPAAPEAWMRRLAALPGELDALPLARLEFAAKRLAVFTAGHGPVLELAAPVFVALAL